MKRKKEMDEMLGWLESMRCFFSPASLWNADLRTATPTHTLVLWTSAQLQSHINMEICISTHLCTCVYRSVGNSKGNKKPIQHPFHNAAPFFILLDYFLSWKTNCFSLNWTEMKGLSTQFSFENICKYFENICLVEDEPSYTIGPC